MSARPSTLRLVALGLVTACTLAAQIGVTRLLSSVLSYHFGFLAVSLAMLGTGAGALLLYVRPTWFAGGDPASHLSRWSAVLGLGLCALPLGVVQLDFSTQETEPTRFGIQLALACLLVLLPTFSAGVVVALAIDRYRAAIGRVYAWDLAGAGLGALLVVPLLGLLPATDLLLWLALAVAMASLMFGGGPRLPGLACLGLALGLLGASQTTGLTYLSPRYPVPKDATLLGEFWTPLSRVFGYRMANQGPGLLFYDRVYAPVPLASEAKLPDWRDLGTGPASIGYQITGPGRALIIGGGGGRDIYNALAEKQHPVDVIELGEGNRRMVDGPLGHVSGKPYSRPGVSTTIGDGRSVLSARSTRYDQIHIGFTDTLSANAAQGYALTENNLYTLEAFQLYLDHLRPGGILNVSRMLKLVGDEALRVTVLSLAALAERGVEDPFQHVVVILGKDVLGPPTGTVLTRLEPFTEGEIQRIEALVAERAVGLLLAPGRPAQQEWKALRDARDLTSFCTGHALDVCPPSDDKPFFFSMQRLGSMGQASTTSGYHYAASPFHILLLTLAILASLSAVGLGVPLLMLGKRRAPPPRELLYFASLGVGFMLIEISLIQRLVLFLGFPTYALSVVLFALLLFSGLGSSLTGRLSEPVSALRRVLPAIALLSIVYAFGLPPLLRATLGLGLAARICLAVTLLAPVGAALGMAMPLGLRRLDVAAADAVPYAWSVNGIGSVLASVLGVALAIQFGFTVVTLSAGACYGIALWCNRAPTEAS